jgi:hypothetical protein
MESEQGAKAFDHGETPTTLGHEKVMFNSDQEPSQQEERTHEGKER